MQKLKDTAPDVYESFVKGKFSVKRTSGNFNSVGVDMCLEQTINRSSKGKGGAGQERISAAPQRHCGRNKKRGAEYQNHDGVLFYQRK